MVGLCSGQDIILCEVRCDFTYISDNAQCRQELAHGLQTVLIAWNWRFPVNSICHFSNRKSISMSCLCFFVLSKALWELEIVVHTFWQETCSAFSKKSATFISTQVLRNEILQNACELFGSNIISNFGHVMGEGIAASDSGCGFRR
jgi:hypothetical protein